MSQYMLNGSLSYHYHVLAKTSRTGALDPKYLQKFPHVIAHFIEALSSHHFILMEILILCISCNPNTIDL
jgi:hypothetical protein